jgi:hypothetical protein
MRLLIKHDARGKILSVARVSYIADSLAHPFGETEKGVGVIEVEETDELAELECHDIHENYRVDVKQQQLAKQQPKKQPTRRAR